MAIEFSDLIPFKISVLNGSPSWTRTSDPMINSHLLYQLSYRGTVFQQTRIVLIAPVLVKFFSEVFILFRARTRVANGLLFIG